MGKGKDGCQNKTTRAFDASSLNGSYDAIIGARGEVDRILRAVQIKSRRGRRNPNGSENLYQQMVDEMAVLTRDQERRLAIIAKLHRDPQEREKARQALVLCNQRWIIKMAQHPDWRGRGVSVEELIQAGNQGLLKAIDKFEVERGNSLLTVAKWWIRQAMQRLTEQQSGNLFGPRVPTDVYMEIGRVRKALAKLSAESHEDPTVAQLAEMTELSEAKVERALGILNNRPISQQQTLGSDEDGDLEFGDTLVSQQRDPIDEAINSERAEALERAFQSLSPQEQIVWGSTHGYGPYEQLSSIDEIVQKFGLKHTTVTRLRNTSRKRLQAALKTSGFEA